MITAGDVYYAGIGHPYATLTIAGQSHWTVNIVAEVIVFFISKDSNPTPILFDTDNLVDIITRHPGNTSGIDCHTKSFGKEAGIITLQIGKIKRRETFRIILISAHQQGHLVALFSIIAAVGNPDIPVIGVAGHALWSKNIAIPWISAGNP